MNDVRWAVIAFGAIMLLIAILVFIGWERWTPLP